MFAVTERLSICDVKLEIEPRRLMLTQEDLWEKKGTKVPRHVSLHAVGTFQTRHGL